MRLNAIFITFSFYNIYFLYILKENLARFLRHKTLQEKAKTREIG